jgi:hypothetical protein
MSMPRSTMPPTCCTLLVMGYGMIENKEDGGKPVVAVVGAAWEKLDAVRNAWREFVETARQAGHSPD